MRYPDLSMHEVSAEVGYVQKAVGLTAAQLPASAMPKVGLRHRLRVS